MSTSQLASVAMGAGQTGQKPLHPQQIRSVVACAFHEMSLSVLIKRVVQMDQPAK